uniref:IQ motif containing K n=1 Tax=Gallus gallus TaxID=9031 RepID=A0A8V0Z3R8_CHICK
MLQPLCIEQFYPSPAADAVVQQLLPIPEAPPLPEAPDPKTCSPQEYLEYYIFPVLLPGMTELLHQAKKEKCFESQATIASVFPPIRRRSKHNNSGILERLSGPL